jgi:hypothetical protein
VTAGPRKRRSSPSGSRHRCRCVFTHQTLVGGEARDDGGVCGNSRTRTNHQAASFDGPAPAACTAAKARFRSRPRRHASRCRAATGGCWGNRFSERSNGPSDGRRSAGGHAARNSTPERCVSAAGTFRAITAGSRRRLNVRNYSATAARVRSIGTPRPGSCIGPAALPVRGPGRPGLALAGAADFERL